MHILAAPAILACTHELVIDSSSAPASPSLPSMAVVGLPFFVDYVHPVEVVLRQVHVLSRLVLHVQRQLFYFITVFVVDSASGDAAWMDQLALGLVPRLAVVVASEIYFRMALIR